jgi:hypothetical protein
MHTHFLCTAACAVHVSSSLLGAHVQQSVQCTCPAVCAVRMSSSLCSAHAQQPVGCKCPAVCAVRALVQQSCAKQCAAACIPAHLTWTHCLTSPMYELPHTPTCTFPDIRFARKPGGSWVRAAVVLPLHRTASWARVRPRRHELLVLLPNKTGMVLPGEPQLPPRPAADHPAG